MTEPTPEAYEAAARAYCLSRFDYPREAYVSDAAHADHIAVDSSSTAEEQWLHDLVDAVVPIIEAQVRAKVAEEIRADCHHPESGHVCRCYRLAARIAEGKEDS